MLSELIKLIYYTAVNDVVNETSVEVLAELGPITRQEFYTSYQSELKPSITLKIWKEDYELTKSINPDTKKAQYATKVLYDGAEYSIIRTYPIENKIELICG